MLSFSENESEPATPSSSRSETVCNTPSTSGLKYNVSPLTRYLVMPVIPTSKSKPNSRRAAGARVLTSADSLRILQEKAQEKRKKEEEKQRQKEEELKQKAELRAKREKKKKQKQCKKDQKKPCKRARTNAGANMDPHTGTGDTANAQKSSIDNNQPRRKRRRVNSCQDEINTEECCVCFVTYEDDVTEQNGCSWIECSCGRWLHEDCSLSEPSLTNEFCPYCVR